MNVTVRPSDILKQLRLYLPQYTDLFSVLIDVQSAVVIADRTVRVTTITENTYQVGDALIVTQGLLQNGITAVEYRENDTIARFTTTDEHDLITPQLPDDIDTVTLTGFTEPAWNISHQLVNVPNRTQFEVPAIGTIPTLTGSEVLFEDRALGLKGVWPITQVNSAFEFEFEVPANTPALPINTITNFKALVDSRIYISDSLVKAESFYTQVSDSQDLALFVVMDIFDISKDRRTETDAIANLYNADESQLQILQNFLTIVFFKTASETVAGQAQELAYGVVYEALLKALFTFRKDNDKSQFLTVPVGHAPGIAKGAYYTQEYSWQLPQYIDKKDGFSDPKDVAFRDINEYELHPFEADNPESWRLRINLDTEQ